MSVYIARLTKEDVDDIRAANDYQMRFLRDAGVTVQKPSEAKHAMGALGEEVKQEKGT